ncbi:glycosyltransferase [Nocardioides bigeumensis]|uniref:Glycosyltransferase 2-like domain-containing protein n=1 Tax=Nocardioides bigeumensis TaxID=433657 RepID=A0ABN2YYM3_9ACTN
MPDTLATFLGEASGDVLVLVDPDAIDLVPPSGAEVVVLPAPELAGAAGAAGATRDLAVLVVRDRLALKPYAEGLEALGRAPVIAVWLAAGSPVLPRPDASWQAVTGVRSRRLDDGGWLVVLRFDAPVLIARALAEVARQAVPHRGGNEGLWVGDAPSPEDADVPVEVVLGGGAGPLQDHPVLGRPPVRLTEPDLSPRLDERLLNPHGFRADRCGPPAMLPPGAVLTESLAGQLREAATVSVSWPADPDRTVLRTVAGLAMSGVVLTSSDVPSWARDALGPAVADALTAQPADDGLLAREEHGLVLRRAAFDAFSTRSWRRRAAARAGVRVAADPAVSVLLATRRADMLDFALSQVARQRGVPLELVLAPHGFEPDEADVRRALGDGVSLVLLPQPEEVAFGDVLHQAALAASGDLLLKMDDDDWYAPDVVADLVRAHRYSGAEVVGMPAEFHYLTGPDITVTRGHVTEVFARFVAGGTLMIERGLLREVGGFRSVHKYVDAQLLAAAAAAGASLYRTHGLGYVLRRNPTGHTWEVDLDYLLDPVRTKQRWDGFRPSRLMEL